MSPPMPRPKLISLNRRCSPWTGVVRSRAARHAKNHDWEENGVDGSEVQGEQHGSAEYYEEGRPYTIPQLNLGHVPVRLEAAV